MKLLTRARVAMVVAEFLGAGLLTYTALSVSKSDLPIAFFAAAAVGSMYALIIIAFGNASGGHANPAVSLAMWSIRRISSLRLLAYIAAQLAGAVLAYRLFITMAKVEDVQPFSWPGSGDNKDFWLVFVAELIGAFVLTALLTAAINRGYRGMRFATVAGTALFAAILLASVVPKPVETLERGDSRFNEGVVNPFVAIGTQHYGWEYVLGPVAGAVTGAVVYTYLFTDAALVLGLGRFGRRSYATTTTVSSVSNRAKSSKPAPRKTTKKATTRKRR